jgi:hypothetical protein
MPVVLAIASKYKAESAILVGKSKDWLAHLTNKLQSDLIVQRLVSLSEVTQRLQLRCNHLSRILAVRNCVFRGRGLKQLFESLKVELD